MHYYYCSVGFVAEAETVITCDEGVRGGKVIPLKAVVDAAVESCPKVKRVFVSKRTGSDVAMGKHDINLDEVTKPFRQAEKETHVIIFGPLQNPNCHYEAI